MQLFGPVENIDEEEIVQKEILHEIVSVIMLFVSNDERLDLGCCQLSDEVIVFRPCTGNEDVFGQLIIIYFKEMESPHLLCLCRRQKEIRCNLCHLIRHRPGGNNLFAVFIQNTEFQV